MNELYLLLANVVAIIHLATALFLVSLPLVICRKKVPRLYIAAQVGVIGIAGVFHFTTGVCPLTFGENYLRTLGGGETYEGNFLSHYSQSYFNVLLPDVLISSSIIILAILLVLTITYRLWLVPQKSTVKS